MGQNNTLIEWLLSDAGKAALAGAAGGIVRWLTLRGKFWPDGVINLAVGCLCAVYIGPLAEPLLEPIVGKIAIDGSADGLGSFLIGLGGISISGFVLDVINMRRSQVVVSDDEQVAEADDEQT